MIVKRFALFVVNLLFYVGSDSRHTEEAQCALQTEKRFFLAKSGHRVCVCVCLCVCVCVSLCVCLGRCENTFILAQCAEFQCAELMTP